MHPHSSWRSPVLIGQAKLADVVQPWGDGKLHVLPSGQVPPNPSEMVGSHAMAWLLGELVKQYDIVIVDAPPLLPVTDAAILARLADGALVVAGANQLHRAQLAEAMDSLEAVGARVLGIVLNHLARKQTDSYAYYGPDSDRPGRRKTSQARSGATKSAKPGRPAMPAPSIAHSSRQRLPARPSTRRPRPTDGAGTPGGGLDDLLGPEQPLAPPKRWPGEPMG